MRTALALRGRARRYDLVCTIVLARPAALPRHGAVSPICRACSRFGRAFCGTRMAIVAATYPPWSLPPRQENAQRAGLIHEVLCHHLVTDVMALICGYAKQQVVLVLGGIGW